MRETKLVKQVSTVKFPTNVNKLKPKTLDGGQVVSGLAFYSDDPSSNPAEAYNFFGKIWVLKVRK